MRLSEDECIVLIEQSGTKLKVGLYPPHIPNIMQTLAVRELHQIVKHAFKAGEDREHQRKRNKKRDAVAD